MEQAVSRAPYVGPIVEAQPDETFYSWIGRIAACFDGLEHHTIRNLLFGGAVPRFYPDFATGLGSFRRWSGQSPLTVAQLAMTMTSFGYYAKFLEPSERSRLLAVLEKTGTSPYHGTGLPFRDVQVLRLRYCPTCHREMDRHGHGRWWRRGHQLQSSLVCPDHGEGLRDSGVTVEVMREGFVLPSPDNCADGPDLVTPKLTKEEVAKLQLLAQLGSKCLSGDAAVTRSQRIDRYRQHWAAARPNGPVFGAAELHRELELFWGTIPDDLWPFRLTSPGWVDRLLKPGKLLPPTFYLLVEAKLACDSSRLKPVESRNWLSEAL